MDLVLHTASKNGDEGQVERMLKDSVEEINVDYQDPIVSTS